jgi:hypothetical protein
MQFHGRMHDAGWRLRTHTSVSQDRQAASAHAVNQTSSQVSCICSCNFTKHILFWNTVPPSLHPLMQDIRCNPNLVTKHTRSIRVSLYSVPVSVSTYSGIIDLNCASKQIKMDGSLTSQVQLQSLPAIYWSLKITTWLHTSQVAQQANMTNIRMHMHHALSWCLLVSLHCSFPFPLLLNYLNFCSY